MLMEHLAPLPKSTTERAANRVMNEAPRKAKEDKEKKAR